MCKHKDRFMIKRNSHILQNQPTDDRQTLKRHLQLQHKLPVKIQLHSSGLKLAQCPFISLASSLQTPLVLFRVCVLLAVLCVSLCVRLLSALSQSVCS